MGRRGPAPTPTPIKQLRGETRPQRLNLVRPKPGPTGVGTKKVSTLPLMPDDMVPRAKEVWRRQMESLGATGVLTPVDSDALRAYCEAVARYEEAARLIAASGPLVKGARSTPERPEYVKNPLHQVVRDNAVLIRLFARELGFVPAGREGLHPGGAGGDEDDFDRWLGLPAGG